MTDPRSPIPEMAGLSGPRYTLGRVLGKGANGVVHLAGDARLGRKVALKLLSDETKPRDKDLLRFTHEAQVTGQLAHPAIVPVHDLGVLPDGRLYYAMKRIEGRSLRDVMADVKRGVPEVSERWTLPHFVSTLLRVCHALAFAHDRGVVHRDVKPANIMVGDYGEVLLLDWGVARVLGPGGARVAHEDEDVPPRPVATWRSLSDRDLTIDGTVAGTPAYMAPEQAKGDIEAIGPWSDVYSIAVILYEFLARARPIRGRTVDELLERVISDPIPPPSKKAPDARIPLELEQLVMRCLHKNRSLRPQDGAALADELEAFLEGSRKREEARELSSKGLARSAGYTRAAEATSEAEADARRLAAETPPWAAPEERRAVWEAEARYRSLRRLRDDTYDESVALLQAALERDPNQGRARDGLAALYLRRMDEAEARGEVEAARFYRSQVLRYDAGRLRDLLVGDSTLTVSSVPSGARVRLYSLVERERGQGVDDGTDIGATPILEHPLPAGRWVVSVELPGQRVVAPVHADRPAPHAVVAAPPAELLPGFVFVPGGAYVRGGDPQALDGADRAIVDVAPFAIARHPVTQGEFEAFLRDVGQAQGFSQWRGPDGYEDHHRARLPALGIPWEAALAYADWASSRTGARLRLPTHDEWEKAARGVDGRVYPWGGPWEPSFCNGPDALPGEPRPEPVGHRRRDESVYGVRDLAGGVHEWVLGDVPHRPDRRWVRGGSWNGHPRAARICSRLVHSAGSRGGTLGLRLVQDA